MAELLNPIKNTEQVIRDELDAHYFIARFIDFEDEDNTISVMDIDSHLQVSVDGKHTPDPEDAKQRASARGFLVDAIVNEALKGGTIEGLEIIASMLGPGPRY